MPDFFNAFLLFVHCIALRFAPAAGNATDKSEYAIKMDKALREIVNFYAHSTNRANTIMKNVLADTAEPATICLSYSKTRYT
jgi:hypothetical protein